MWKAEKSPFSFRDNLLRRKPTTATTFLRLLDSQNCYTSESRVYQNGAEDDFYVKVVNTKEETTEPLEAELDYVLENEDSAN